MITRSDNAQVRQVSSASPAKADLTNAMPAPQQARTRNAPERFDVVIIGGGFFGCCLALYFRSITKRILILEQGQALMERASAVNQARVHTGFHYPRSFATARRSQINYSIFTDWFRDSIIDDFDMLYAISRNRSHVSAKRFLATFSSMNAPIKPANEAEFGLFSKEMIEAVFKCTEFAFDYTKLRDHVATRLEAAAIEVAFGTAARGILSSGSGRVTITLSNGEEIDADTVFNVTYAQLNATLLNAQLEQYRLKHELTELAIVDIPEELEGLAVTVMDGPFFSVMPYPARQAYSLTHVRYTPHFSWLDQPGTRSPYALAAELPRRTRWRQMRSDAARYMPCLERLDWRESLFEVKTVMRKNEGDDGRPILLKRHQDMPQLISVLGGKIDNIFDLLQYLPGMNAAWSGLNADRLR